MHRARIVLVACSLATALAAAPSTARADDPATDDDAPAPATDAAVPSPAPAPTPTTDGAPAAVPAPTPAPAPTAEPLPVPPRRIRTVAWRSEWPRFRWWEGVIATAGWAGTITSGYLLPDTPFGWRGRNGFDEGVRDALQWPTYEGRLGAALVSDAMFYGLAAFPIVVDGLILAWGVHGKPDVALQLVLTDIEALGVAGLLSSITERTGRERPYVRECNPTASSDRPPGTFTPEAPCDETGHNQSFVSGHTAAAFAGAGLVCAHHLALPLFGSRLVDVGTCTAAMASASVAGYLRIAADVHYATDVLGAAVVGLGSGLVLPLLLRFRPGPGGRNVRFTPVGAGGGLGFGISGTLP